MPAHLKYPKLPDESKEDRKRRVQRLRYQTNPVVRQRRNAWSAARHKATRDAMTPEEKHVVDAKRYAQNKERNALSVQPEYRRRQGIQQRYGIDPDHIDWLIALQDNCCGLCKLPFKQTKGLAPVVDHDHNTNTFRGVIHGNCNSGIGYLQDNATICRQAAEYLELAPPQQEPESSSSICDIQ